MPAAWRPSCGRARGHAARRCNRSGSARRRGVRARLRCAEEGVLEVGVQLCRTGWDPPRCDPGTRAAPCLAKAWHLGMVWRKRAEEKKPSASRVASVFAPAKYTFVEEALGWRQMMWEAMAVPDQEEPEGFVGGDTHGATKSLVQTAADPAGIGSQDMLAAHLDR